MIKINELASHKTAWRKLKCILLRERNHSEKATYCNTKCMQNNGDSKKISGCLWAPGKGKESRAQEIFRVVKLFCMIP